MCSMAFSRARLVVAGGTGAYISPFCAMLERERPFVDAWAASLTRVGRDCTYADATVFVQSSLHPCMYRVSLFCIDGLPDVHICIRGVLLDSQKFYKIYMGRKKK